MGTTPRGIRYPEPTDLVTNGATAMQNLAEDVDAEFDTFDGFIGATVYKTADQSVATGSNDTVTFDAEELDSGGFHDNATNNHRLTAPVAGRYLVTAQVGFGTNTTGARSVIIYKNGVNTRATAAAAPVSGGFATVLTATAIVTLNAGDYIHASAFHDSGVSLAIKSTSTQLSIARLGS